MTHFDFSTGQDNTRQTEQEISRVAYSLQTAMKA